MDRGDYPRPVEHWNTLFSKHFTPVLLIFDLKRIGIPFWKMVYFKEKET